MYLKEYLKQFEEKKVKLFIDMDGVIVDYVVGSTSEFDKRRPLMSSISKLKEISEQNNIELYILSVTRMDEGIEQKETWLDKYADFFDKDKRFIISRQSNEFKSSSKLKSEFFEELTRDGSVIILIDDDPVVLKEIMNTSSDVVLLKDTALVD